MFAQHGIKAAEVQHEVERVRQELGTEDDLQGFLESAIPLFGGVVEARDGCLAVDLSDADPDLAELAPGRAVAFVARTALPVADGEAYLTRTHPFVEALGAKVLDVALNPSGDRTVARCGTSETDGVVRPTVVFLARHRILLTVTEDGVAHPSLAEHCEFLAADWVDGELSWVETDGVEQLLDQGDLMRLPTANGSTPFKGLSGDLAEVATRLDERSEAIAAVALADHLRVREASKRTGVRYSAVPASTPDIIGAYALTPPGGK